ncbi:MAG: SDR family oxidoreductase [Acidimicrobiaceae bacterium]|nr:SDR family oxidoreductase [Acidimicrobiaceae bacterium]
MSDTSATAAPRVAIVTGAGSGIGQVSALALAADGFSVVCAGRREAAIEETRAKIEADGGNALCVVTDVTEEQSVLHLFDETIRTYGRLDVLFNNAGISMRAVPMPEIDLAEWNRVVATNLTGLFLCTREAFRIMRDQDPQGGRIINNGSISAHTPRPNSPAYTATKHAVTGLTKSTSLDGRDYHIACGQIDVGNAGTAMTARLGGGAGASVPAEARMDVADVGRAVSYMASLPLDTNVLFMTVMANAMPFIGRG